MCFELPARHSTGTLPLVAEINASYKFVTECIRQYCYDRIGGSFRYNHPTAQTIATSVSLNKQAPLKQKLEKL